MAGIIDRRHKLRCPVGREIKRGIVTSLIVASSSCSYYPMVQQSSVDNGCNARVLSTHHRQCKKPLESGLDFLVFFFFVLFSSAARIRVKRYARPY